MRDCSRCQVSKDSGRGSCPCYSHRATIHIRLVYPSHPRDVDFLGPLVTHRNCHLTLSKMKQISPNENWPKEGSPLDTTHNPAAFLCNYILPCFQSNRVVSPASQILHGFFIQRQNAPPVCLCGISFLARGKYKCLFLVIFFPYGFQATRIIMTVLPLAHSELSEV